jgi:hypothetical protein
LLNGGLSAAAVATFGASASWPAAEAGAGAAVSAGAARLEIKGNELLSGGKPIRLLGIAVGDSIYIRSGASKRTIADYGILARDWNANTVRISLHPGHWRHARGMSFDALTRDVNAARASGLFVIIDWHSIGFPGQYTSPVDPSWGLVLDAFDTDPELAADFWNEMAQTYGRDPGILFELWNEPVYNARLWKSTGEHWPQMKALWLKLIAVIRRHSENIIIVSGGRWAHDLVGVVDDLIDDPRVGYAWHCYPAEVRGVRDWSESLGGLSKVKPVFVTEWGFQESHPHLGGTAADFGEPFVRNVLEPHRLHSTAWCYSSGATPRLLSPDGMTPSKYGEFVKKYLREAWRP